MSHGYEEERCAPKRVGFASAVDNLIARAQAREAENAKELKEGLDFEKEHDAFQDWLVSLGATAESAAAALERHERITKAKGLRAMAAKYRAIWAPEPCPWVGALDDEADLLERGL